MSFEGMLSLNVTTTFITQSWEYAEAYEDTQQKCWVSFFIFTGQQGSNGQQRTEALA